MRCLLCGIAITSTAARQAARRSDTTSQMQQLRLRVWFVLALLMHMSRHSCGICRKSLTISLTIPVIVGHGWEPIGLSKFRANQGGAHRLGLGQRRGSNTGSSQQRSRRPRSSAYNISIKIKSTGLWILRGYLSGTCTGCVCLDVSRCAQLSCVLPSVQRLAGASLDGSPQHFCTCDGCLLADCRDTRSMHPRPGQRIPLRTLRRILPSRIRDPCPCPCLRKMFS